MQPPTFSGNIQYKSSTIKEVGLALKRENKQALEYVVGAAVLEDPLAVGSTKVNIFFPIVWL
jgi:hypothetical protein